MLMRRYDVILTLGNGLTVNWGLPKIVTTRLLYISKLYNQKLSDTILVSGGYSISWDLKRIKPLTTEAEEMERTLIHFGVPQKAIFKEEESRDTIGNFYFSKVRYFIPNKWRYVLIVCEDFHLKRVKFLAKKIFGDEYRLSYQTTISESINNVGFMRTQDDILKKQRSFLKNMQIGDNRFLASRLYDNPYYHVKRSKQVAQMSMNGAM